MRKLLAGGVLCASVGGLVLPAWAGTGPTDGDDVLHGTPGRDRLSAMDGDDTVYGYRGDDDLAGGAGRDGLYGGRGNDDLRGGSDADTLSGGPRHDEVYGNGGADELRAGADADIVVPGAGADVVHAGPGDDEIFIDSDGRPDTIFCDRGHDWVEISLGRGEQRDLRDRFVECEDVYVDRNGGES